MTKNSKEWLQNISSDSNSNKGCELSSFSKCIIIYLKCKSLLSCLSKLNLESLAFQGHKHLNLYLSKSKQEVPLSTGCLDSVNGQLKLPCQHHSNEQDMLAEPNSFMLNRWRAQSKNVNGQQINKLSLSLIKCSDCNKRSRFPLPIMVFSLLSHRLSPPLPPLFFINLAPILSLFYSIFFCPGLFPSLLSVCVMKRRNQWASALCLERN